MSGDFDPAVSGDDMEEGVASSHVIQSGNNLMVFDPQAARERRAARDVEERQAKERTASEVDEKLRPFMNTLLDAGSEHKDKIDALQVLQSSILPDLFKEVSAMHPNTDRTLAASRTIAALSQVFKTLNERKSLDEQEEINPHSPKLQLVLGWFIELLAQAMTRQGADQILINNTFNDIAASLVGWEDITAKKLKGVAAKALSGIRNPFLESFWELTKGNAVFSEESNTPNKE